MDSMSCMNKRFFLGLLVFFFIFQDVQAQSNKAEFQTALIGTVHYSKKSIKSFSEFGVNYQPFLFPKTYLVLGLQGNTRNYEQNSTDTADLFTGEMKYKQWMASIGVRYLFKEEIVETVNYFAEFNFHYLHIKTEGDFKGGNFGPSYYRYNRFNGVGLSFKAGGIYQFNSPWYVGANFALYMSGGKSGEIANYAVPTEADKIIDDLPDNKTFTRPGLEVRLGYRLFKK